MIATLVQSLDGEPVMVFDDCVQAWECMDMLDATYPFTTDETSLYYNHSICCAGGYENGILFSV